MEIASLIIALTTLLFAVVMAFVLWEKSEDQEGRLNVAKRNIEATDDKINKMESVVGDEFANIHERGRRRDMRMEVLDFELHNPDSKYSIVTGYTLTNIIPKVAYLSADHSRVCRDLIKVVDPNFTIEKNVKINGDYIELYDDEGKLYEVYTVDKQDELTKLRDLDLYKNAKAFKENECMGKEPVKPVKEDCIRHNVEQIVEDELLSYSVSRARIKNICDTLTEYVKGEIEDATNTL